MTREDVRKEHCLRIRLGKRHFRALRDRARQNWPVAAPWEALCTPLPARVCVCGPPGVGAMLIKIQNGNPGRNANDRGQPYFSHSYAGRPQLFNLPELMALTRRTRLNYVAEIPVNHMSTKYSQENWFTADAIFTVQSAFTTDEGRDTGICGKFQTFFASYPSGRHHNFRHVPDVDGNVIASQFDVLLQDFAGGETRIKLRKLNIRFNRERWVHSKDRRDNQEID